MRSTFTVIPRRWKHPEKPKSGRSGVSAGAIQKRPEGGTASGRGLVHFPAGAKPVTKKPLRTYGEPGWWGLTGGGNS